jgi:hypothetical protein
MGSSGVALGGAAVPGARGAGHLLIRNINLLA